MMMSGDLLETGAMCQLTDFLYTHICSRTYKPGSYSNDVHVCRSAASSFLIHGNIVIMHSV